MSGSSSSRVVVIGAGPAGAGAALRLAQLGVGEVTLVERQALPRFKVCGGCLHRKGVARLGRWGVAERVLRAADASALSVSEVVAGGRTLRWPRAHGVSIDRASFDAGLVEAARAAGVAVIAGTPARVERTAVSGEAGYVVRLGGRDTGELLEADWVLVADGLGGSSLAGLGEAWKVRRAADTHVGAGVVLDGAMGLATDAVRMHVAPGGYVGVVRANGGAARVELAAALDPALVKRHGGAGGAVASLLSASGAAADWGRAAEQADGWRLTPALTAWRERVAEAHSSEPHPGGGLLVVGDAAGYVEPFTGEGIAWALEAGERSAAAVARCLAGGRPAGSTAAGWSAWVRRRRRWGRAWCRGCRWALRRPRGVSALVAVGSWWPGLRVSPKKKPVADSRVGARLAVTREAEAVS